MNKLDWKVEILVSGGIIGGRAINCYFEEEDDAMATRDALETALLAYKEDRGNRSPVDRRYTIIHDLGELCIDLDDVGQTLVFNTAGANEASEERREKDFAREIEVMARVVREVIKSPVSAETGGTKGTEK